MKVLLGQINTTPGDFDGNVSKIEQVLWSIKQDSRPDMAIFPELSVCGYLSRDLVFETHYVERNLQALNKIVNISFKYRDVAIVVGYIDHNKTGIGKPFANMLAVIKNGTIIGTYQKHLLPFYDVFDEGRYYEPGTQLLVLNITGHRVGFTICEDVWNDKGSDCYSYEDNPIGRYRKCGVDTIVNISSSPFVHDKPFFRMHMLEKVSSDGGLTLIYVNQQGGQDDLVFDGHSCVIRNGFVVECLSPSTEKDDLYNYVEVDTKSPTSYVCDETVQYTDRSRIHNIYEMCLTGLYDYVTKSGFKSVVLGSSGGIDSAVVAALACEIFDPKTVHCIMMPSKYSSEGSVNDAKKLHENLGCNEYLEPIDASFAESFDFGFMPGHYNESADENIQARLRGITVMYFSNANGSLPLTTGNKTELATGYCTLYGDMNGGFAPISDLYKMEVYELAKYINKKHNKEIIPKAIIDKAPSAELKPGQTDEASLLPYPILDDIVKSYVEHYVDTFDGLRDYVNSGRGLASKPIAKWLDTPNASKDYYRIVRLININEFKRRQAAPGIKLSRVAFGTGRRLPIVKKMRM